VQGTDISGPNFHICVDVNSGKVQGCLISGYESSTLGRNRDGDHAYHGPADRSDLGRIIGAAVGHHDHIEFAWLGGTHELLEQTAYHPGLVMCGNYDSHHPASIDYPTQLRGELRIIAFGLSAGSTTS
jgi:hypothetical protein